MKLPIQATAPARKDPKMLVVFGQTKVGKTTKLSQLPAGKYLVVDTEEGSDYLAINRIQVKGLADLAAVMQELRTNAAEYPFDYIALDVLDTIVEWVTAAVHAEYGVKDTKDIPYGAGYSQIRDRVMQILKAYKSLGKKLIIVGHRKKTTGETDSPEFSASTLDISGKLKNFICADADAIGYCYRDENGNLMISFTPSDFVEAGARPEHLRGKVMPFEWHDIYIEDPNIQKTPRTKLNAPKPVEAQAAV